MTWAAFFQAEWHNEKEKMPLRGAHQPDVAIYLRSVMPLRISPPLNTSQFLKFIEKRTIRLTIHIFLEVLHLKASRLKGMLILIKLCSMGLTFQNSKLFIATL